MHISIEEMYLVCDHCQKSIPEGFYAICPDCSCEFHLNCVRENFKCKGCSSILELEGNSADSYRANPKLLKSSTIFQTEENCAESSNQNLKQSTFVDSQIFQKPDRNEGSAEFSRIKNEVSLKKDEWDSEDESYATGTSLKAVFKKSGQRMISRALLEISGYGTDPVNFLENSGQKSRNGKDELKGVDENRLPELNGIGENDTDEKPKRLIISKEKIEISKTFEKETKYENMRNIISAIESNKIQMPTESEFMELAKKFYPNFMDLIYAEVEKFLTEKQKVQNSSSENDLLPPEVDQMQNLFEELPQISDDIGDVNDEIKGIIPKEPGFLNGWKEDQIPENKELIPRLDYDTHQKVDNEKVYGVNIRASNSKGNKKIKNRSWEDMVLKQLEREDPGFAKDKKKLTEITKPSWEENSQIFTNENSISSGGICNNSSSNMVQSSGGDSILRQLEVYNSRFQNFNTPNGIAKIPLGQHEPTGNGAVQKHGMAQKIQETPLHPGNQMLNSTASNNCVGIPQVDVAEASRICDPFGRSSEKCIAANNSQVQVPCKSTVQNVNLVNYDASVANGMIPVVGITYEKCAIEPDSADINNTQMMQHPKVKGVVMPYRPDSTVVNHHFNPNEQHVNENCEFLDGRSQASKSESCNNSQGYRIPKIQPTTYPYRAAVNKSEHWPRDTQFNKQGITYNEISNSNYGVPKTQSQGNNCGKTVSQVPSMKFSSINGSTGLGTTVSNMYVQKGLEGVQMVTVKFPGNQVEHCVYAKNENNSKNSKNACDNIIPQIRTMDPSLESNAPPAFPIIYTINPLDLNDPSIIVARSAGNGVNHIRIPYMNNLSSESDSNEKHNQYTLGNLCYGITANGGQNDFPISYQNAGNIQQNDSPTVNQSYGNGASVGHDLPPAQSYQNAGNAQQVHPFAPIKTSYGNRPYDLPPAQSYQNAGNAYVHSFAPIKTSYGNSTSIRHYDLPPTQTYQNVGNAQPVHSFAPIKRSYGNITSVGHYDLPPAHYQNAGNAQQVQSMAPMKKSYGSGASVEQQDLLPAKSYRNNRSVQYYDFSMINQNYVNGANEHNDHNRVNQSSASVQQNDPLAFDPNYGNLTNTRQNNFRTIHGQLNSDSERPQYRDNFQEIHNMSDEDYADHLKQQTFLDYVLIRGVPERSDENLYEIVIKLAKVLNFKIETNDIIYVGRSPDNRDMPRSILVRFRDNNLKCKLIDSRKKLHNFSCKKLGFMEESSIIFVNELLTLKRSNLYNQVQIQKQLYGYKHCWIKNGCIYIKKKTRSPPIKMLTEQDLHKLG